MVQKKCTHNGCGKTYNEEDNNEYACVYHPGAPIFHEGQKGWACCKKRVITFDEFMTIPGCSTGFHATEAPQPAPQPTPPKKEPEVTLTSTPGDTVEVYKTQPVNIGPSAPAPKPAPPPEEEEDPADAVIAPGTSCKHRGCEKRYVNESSRFEQCVYHPGVPIFHEGSKGYSCCKMVGDFDEFLRLRGCKTGKHKFTEKNPVNTQEAQCRHDWYQMGPTVVVCVYAKNVDKQKSSVSFDPNALHVNLVFPDGKKYTKDFALSQPIVPDKSKYEILSTKVEIKLAKVGATQWATLE
jgi:hypothetical protein